MSMLLTAQPAGGRFSNMADATKAMQQIDGLEIANQKISVKIAALSPAETAAAAVAAAVDLDDDEGAASFLHQRSLEWRDRRLHHCPQLVCLACSSIQQRDLRCMALLRECSLTADMPKLCIIAHRWPRQQRRCTIISSGKSYVHGRHFQSGAVTRA